MLFNLDFANNTILLYFCLLTYYFIELLTYYFVIAAVTAQIFNPIAELVIPIGIPAKEAKAEIEIHQVIVEPKIRKCSI